MNPSGKRFFRPGETSLNERDAREFFSQNFIERTSSRGSPVNGPVVITNTRPGSSSLLTSTLRALSTVVILVLIFNVLRKVYEEMEALAGGDDGEERDAFDKMFGSEFVGKFKNSRLNDGVHRRIREEQSALYAKVESNTTPPPEIRRMIPTPDAILLTFLRSLIASRTYTLEDVYRSPHHPSLFRLLYRGYTYRELLSPKTCKEAMLHEASEYILQSLQPLT